jgi:hypothetical protein
MRQQTFFLCRAIDPGFYEDVTPEKFYEVSSYGLHDNDTCSNHDLNITLMFKIVVAFIPEKVDVIIPDDYRPHVVYFSTGLHLLHLLPVRPFENAVASVRHEANIQKSLQTFSTVRCVQVWPCSWTLSTLLRVHAYQSYLLRPGVLDMTFWC